ncbi:MAG TPA: hypothetical protein PK609_00275 [Candidatus Paceibacterota bacterium]|nr:hypothetical protein [Candidatus Paceibacterota bacterium]
MKYNHTGIPTKEIQKDEMYLAHLKMTVTDHEANPYRLQWMRFDPDATYPALVLTTPHVAFEVDDLSAALKGKKVIIEPNSPSPGLVVAFIEETAYL